MSDSNSTPRQLFAHIVKVERAVVEKLSQDEKNEKIIRTARMKRNQKAFAEFIADLAAFHSKRLYREDYGTFDEYCEAEWDIKRGRAYQLIGAAQVIENLSTMVDIPLPTSERQIRPMVGQPAEVQTEIYKEALANAPEGKAPTSSQVQAAKDKVVPPKRKPKPIVVTTEDGEEVPPNALCEEWYRRGIAVGIARANALKG